MSGPAGSFPALLLLLTASAPAAQTPDGTREPDEVWESLVRKAGTFQHDHQYAKAAKIAERALAEALRFPPDDPRRGTAHLFLGNVYRDWGRCAEARANYAHAVAIWQKSPPPDPKAMFTALTTQISEALECNDLPAAEKLIRVHSGELRRFRSGPLDDANILGLHSGIALRRGRYSEAENLVRKALRIFESSPGAQAVEIADLRNLLSLLANKRRHYRESLAEARRAMDILETDPHNPSLVASLNNAAYALLSLGRIDESIGFYRRALDLSTEVLGEENRVTATIMVNYATALQALHRPEAESVARKGQEAYRRALLRDSQTVNVQELGTPGR